MLIRISISVELVQMLPDQMRQNFGIGRGFESMALLQKSIFQPVEILDDAVVDNGNAPALVEMRMRVFVGGRTMSGPPRMPHADMAVERLSVEKTREALVDLSLFLAQMELSIAQDGQASAIIAAIFEPSQTLENNRRRLLFADVSNNATHKNEACALITGRAGVRPS